MEGESRWSLDFLIALPLVVLVILLFIAATAAMFYGWRRERNRTDRYYSEPGLFLATWIVLAVVTVIAIGIAAYGFFPYEKEYHAYYKKVGSVQSISKRLLGSSDSFQEKFVIRYTDGRQFGCEDTRCALVKPGETLILNCIREWEFQGSDGYNCAYVGRTR